MPAQHKTGRTRAGLRIGAALGAGALVAGLVAGPLESTHAFDLIDWPFDGHGSPSQGFGSQGFGGEGFGGQGSGSQTFGQPSDSTTTADPASKAESRGIVLINTQIYTGAEAAGTGIVLSSSGTVVTNYHVVEGSTSIKVTVASTGKTYTATMVGHDQSADIAVLKLSKASGLTKATLDTATLKVGKNVTAVGNAGGTGVLTQAKGTVTALGQRITTQAEDTVAAENLTGLIQTDANVQPGDSGGPLLDGQNEVTGIDAAASSGGPTEGYAIPISTALRIAGQIESGKATETVRIGAAAYLGVQVTTAGTDQSSGQGGQGGFGQGGSDQGGSDQGGWGQDWGQGSWNQGWSWGGWGQGWGQGGWGSYDNPFGNSYGDQPTTAGAQVAEVEGGTPAARAGLAEGDVITGVDSTSITSADALTATLKNYRPGDSVSLSWTDQDGQQHSASVTLGSSPIN